MTWLAKVDSNSHKSLKHSILDKRSKLTSRPSGSPQALCAVFGRYKFVHSIPYRSIPRSDTLSFKVYIHVGNLFITVKVTRLLKIIISTYFGSRFVNYSWISTCFFNLFMPKVLWYVFMLSFGIFHSILRLLADGSFFISFLPLVFVQPYILHP